jgi:glycosyltransferase involved in cell wall biosynthesis
MIKVLYIVSTLRKTGPIVVLGNIIKYLDRSKFTPIILTLSHEPKESLQDYFITELHTNVETLGLSRLKGFFLAKKRIKNFLIKNNIDFIHTHGLRADIIVDNLSTPFISTIHNYPYYDYPLRHGKIKGNLMAKKHLKFILNNPQNCIACAKTISYEFRQNGLNLKYIQNGVDTDKFYQISKEEKNKLKKDLNIVKSKKVFISTGALIARKDMKTLIKGFMAFNKNKSNILLIAGEGEERQNLENIADDSIVFLGNVSNINQYLQASDCFISSSLAEGLPNSVLEAMACGLPTILSDIPSHRELYQDEEGLFFHIKNITELTNKLKLIENNLETISKLSKNIIEKKFSAKIMSYQYQKIYSLKQ